MPAQLSRRTFLSTAVAAGAVALRGPRLWAADAPAGGKYGGFDMGIQSYTLRGYKADEALNIIHELGLHRVEFFDSHFPISSKDDQIEAMKKKLADLDIKITAHGVNHFDKDHDANRKKFEFAKKAGIPTITADPSEDAFESLDKLVAEYDIKIAIHNHGPGARYNKIDDVLRAIKGHDTRIGACADLGHYIRSAEDPVKAITLFADRLHGVHLKDFSDMKKDAKGVILGKGHLDLEGVFRALRKVNFHERNGALSLEYEENPKDPIADVKE